MLPPPDAVLVAGVVVTACVSFWTGEVVTLGSAFVVKTGVAVMAAAAVAAALAVAVAVAVFLVLVLVMVVVVVVVVLEVVVMVVVVVLVLVVAVVVVVVVVGHVSSQPTMSVTVEAVPHRSTFLPSSWHRAEVSSVSLSSAPSIIHLYCNV